MRASFAANDLLDASPVAVPDQQHLHHLLVGAAVQRPFERADAADRRIDVGQRRGGDAAGERGRVQLVVGVKR